MSVATFDTHAAVRALEEAGMNTPQAEAVTETVRTAVVQGVATKADIADLRTDLEKLRTDLERLRADLTWRMVLVVGALLALATALDRLLGA